MMLKNLLKSIAISIGLGSFIYLLNGVTGAVAEVTPQEIISVWIASALIGVASALYYTKMESTLVTVVQFGTGIIAFTTIAVFNGWITLNPTDIIFYAGATFVIMLLIFLVFYIISVLDSRRINEKLNEK